MRACTVTEESKRNKDKAREIDAAAAPTFAFVWPIPPLFPAAFLGHGTGRRPPAALKNKTIGAYHSIDVVF